MKRILTILITTALLASCYEAELHEAETEVIFEIETPIGSEGTELTESMIIIFDGEEYVVEPGDTFTLDEFVDLGQYTYYMYTSIEEEDQARVTYDVESGRYIASVDFDENGNVVSSPNALYFGSGTIEVTVNGAVVEEAVSLPITCDLHFKLELIGDAADRLTGVSAMLDGVAQQWDCIDDVPYGESASVIPTLTKTTRSITRSDDSEIHYLEGTVHILGISTGDTQLLTLELTYDDLHPDTHSYTSDVSALLADFNSDKTTSTTLTNSVETPTEANLEGAIGDWDVTYYKVVAN